VQFIAYGWRYSLIEFDKRKNEGSLFSTPANRDRNHNATNGKYSGAHNFQGVLLIMVRRG
jgi:hypothetical protein